MVSGSRVAGDAAVVAALLATSDTARAHVKYVVDSPSDAAAALAFLLATLSESVHAGLVVGGGLATIVVAVAYLWVRPLRADIDAFRRSMADYEHLVPWLLRIAIGFPLVGAGFSGYYFSPVVQVEARLLQVTLGFLLLFGLATRAAALAGATLYLISLPSVPEIVLASEFVPGFLAIVLLGPGSPSADEVLSDVAGAEGTLYGRIDPVHELAAWLDDALEPYRRYQPAVVRVGLGLNFAYLGFVEKLLNPGLALAVVEKYDLTAVVPVAPELWVVGAGLTEIAVGTALVLGAFTRASALVALFLFTTTLFGLPDDPVLAHLSLFGLASTILITGSGPLSVDSWLASAAAPDATEHAPTSGR